MSKILEKVAEAIRGAMPPHSEARAKAAISALDIDDLKQLLKEKEDE
jgi:hypothetical protein